MRPFILASVKGHASVVKVLLDGGADINAKDDRGGDRPEETSLEGQAKLSRCFLLMGRIFMLRMEMAGLP